jgi:hypothetical protein
MEGVYDIYLHAFATLWWLPSGAYYFMNIIFNFYMPLDQTFCFK